MTRVLLSAAAALALAGCVTDPPTDSSELETLARECAGRGGILVPVPGATSTNERANNACEIRGGPGRAG